MATAERRDGCRRVLAATAAREHVSRRDAEHINICLRRLGRRAEAGPRQLQCEVRRRIWYVSPTVTRQTIIDLIGVAGSMLSLLGVIIAVVQVRKARKAAEAAEVASLAAQKTIANKVILIDVSASAQSVEEVKAHIRSQKFESALLRVTDLNALIIQLQHVPSTNTPPDWQIREMLTNLSVLRDLLEQKLHDPAVVVETPKVNAELSRIADDLGHWIAGRKFTM
ncbi:MAG TPA: hypothetical protein VJV21_08020 [Pyrinomonadaceae bacterium]|nr:hypothetical protein [Pyrinomonadaceae bacterium]